jgi:hypothetical protein
MLHVTAALTTPPVGAVVNVPLVAFEGIRRPPGLAAPPDDASLLSERPAFRLRRTSSSVKADIDVPRIPTESSHKIMSKLGHKMQ